MLRRRLDHLSLKARPLKLRPLEHQILRELRKFEVPGRPLVLAVSGGLDSILLLHVLVRLQPLLHSALYVAHIHHGPGSSRQSQYRAKAAKFVEAQCARLGVPFLTNKRKPRVPLLSEEALRDFRLAELKKIQVKKNALLVLAHHQDDLVETQLIRLLRGTGAQGLVAMSFFSGQVLRPFLGFGRAELQSLARELKVDWLEDPSNQSIEPLRNWLRQKWLGPLRRSWPGLEGSLARSLATVAERSHSSKVEPLQDGLDRVQFTTLGHAEKCAAIVSYLRVLNIRNYTQGQIEEIIRRLDNSQGEYKFSVLKHEWRINAQRIQALKH